jgi:FixJ family two-component response regulator
MILASAQTAVSCRGKKKESMNVMHALVSAVDDDESVRESLPELLRSFGLEGRPFSSAEEFLESSSLVRTDCLVLDVARR